MCAWYAFRFQGCVVFGIDFEEVVENNEEHSSAAEEDGEGVEGVI